MKKILLMVFIAVLICGCNSKEKSDTNTVIPPTPEEEIVSTKDEVNENTSKNTNFEDKKEEPIASKDKIPKEDQTKNETQNINNNESKLVKEKDIIIPKLDEKSKEETKIESEKKEQITDSGEKENIFVEDKDPIKKEEPPVEETKPLYQIGNSGKLFDSESEAYAEAEKQFDKFDDPEKYVSGYMVYSTFDKWTISYTYTYY
ncbi:hypothetical protein [uncultured Thomasclavelia sp.]|uniref:hypothetical protein n=1 Tax=uncultured Thomasclavelia sp. TaxID=3025759 RepID=UPI002593BFA1|nr:hypothetical protein [uncultured Thomasclavelia sp.]